MDNEKNFIIEVKLLLTDKYVKNNIFNLKLFIKNIDNKLVPCDIALFYCNDCFFNNACVAICYKYNTSLMDSAKQIKKAIIERLKECKINMEDIK